MSAMKISSGESGKVYYQSTFAAGYQKSGGFCE